MTEIHAAHSVADRVQDALVHARLAFRRDGDTFEVLDSEESEKTIQHLRRVTESSKSREEEA